MKTEADQQIATVEIGEGAINDRRPRGIVVARLGALVFRPVAGDVDGEQLATVKRLVASVLGGTNPADWRGGPAGVLRELLRTCNNGYVYARPLTDQEEG